MGPRSDNNTIELLYDDGVLFQNCLEVIRVSRKIGREPFCVRMNVNTAKAILAESDFVFAEEAQVYLKIGDLPVELMASLKDNHIVLGYY